MRLIIDIDENMYKACQRAVDNPKMTVDTVDVAIANGTPYEERPQGEWINQEQGAFYPIECSKCHNEPFCDDEGYVLSNFCPKCGAKMKGETK